VQAAAVNNRVSGQERDIPEWHKKYSAGFTRAAAAGSRRLRIGGGRQVVQQGAAAVVDVRVGAGLEEDAQQLMPYTRNCRSSALLAKISVSETSSTG